MLLAEITATMGDALERLAADGIEIDRRSARLFIDQFCALWKAAPERGDFLKVKALVDAVRDDERLHGGLLSRATLHLANEVEQAIKAKPHD